jgi:transposase
MNNNKIAPDGAMYVCAACGKRSLDRYGEQPLDNGWDESCMLNSMLVWRTDTRLSHYRAWPVK